MLPRCAAPSPSSSWTSTPSTPRATRRASARWCSAGSSAAGSSPARRRPSTSSAQPSSARSSRASSRHRRARPAHAAASPRPTPRAACSSTSTWPARTPTISGRSIHATRVEVGRQLAREHPVDADLVIPRPGVGHPGRGRLRQASGIPYGAGPGEERLRRPDVHPASARPSASSASGSSSTRCARSSAASGSSSSTTRSCAATPSAPSCGCCARPAPPRSTCGSPRRR